MEFALDRRCCLAGSDFGTDRQLLNQGGLDQGVLRSSRATCTVRWSMPLSLTGSSPYLRVEVGRGRMLVFFEQLLGGEAPGLLRR